MNERGDIFLLFSCDEWKSHSSMSLVVATTSIDILEDCIREEISNGDMECEGKKGKKGVAQYNEHSQNRSLFDAINSVKYSHVMIVEDGEVQ